MNSPLASLGVACALAFCAQIAPAAVTVVINNPIVGRDQNSSTTVNSTSSFTSVYGSKPVQGAFYTGVTITINSISKTNQSQGFLVNGAGDNNVTGNGVMPNFGFISGLNSNRFAVAAYGNNTPATVGKDMNGNDASWEWSATEMPQIGEIFSVVASMVWTRPVGFNSNERQLTYTYKVTRSDPGGKLSASERTLVYTVQSTNRANDSFMSSLGKLVVKGGGNPPTNDPFQYTVSQIKFSDTVITSAPEPSSVMLVGAGLMGALLRRKRSRTGN